MDLLELMIFLQGMATDNLQRHEEQDPDDAFEIGYHTGQLSILDVLIPRTPRGVEPLECPEDASDEAPEEESVSGEFVTEVLGEIELTKEVILRHFWVRDILMLSGIDWRMVRHWSPDEGEKIQVVWQRKVWPEGSEYNG